MTERITPDQLRLSDAERDQAARLLGEHYVAGRLTLEEHGERTSAVYTARTRGELPPLFTDLPGDTPWTSLASPVRTRVGVPRGHGAPRRAPVPTVLGVLGALLLLVLVLSSLPWILLGLVAFAVISRRLGRRSAACRTPARAVYR